MQASLIGVSSMVNGSHVVSACSWRSHERPVGVVPRRGSTRKSYSASQEWRQANPTFDEVQLDEEYYADLGISADELADQLSFLASDTDPEGEDLTPDSLLQSQEGSSFLLDEEMNVDAWGPQVGA